MEVGKGPNWGCSAKRKGNEKQIAKFPNPEKTNVI
jgi:hypothetical protein